MSINSLGKIGDGQTFDEKLYKKAYGSVDKLGFGKIAKQMVIVIVTKMLSDAKK